MSQDLIIRESIDPGCNNNNNKLAYIVTSRYFTRGVEFSARLTLKLSLALAFTILYLSTQNHIELALKRNPVISAHVTA